MPDHEAAIPVRRFQHASSRMLEHAHGAWVPYDDVLALRRRVSCVWCGFQFDSTMQFQAQHLYDHASTCEKHPLKKALDKVVQFHRATCRREHCLLDGGPEHALAFPEPTVPDHLG